LLVEVVEVVVPALTLMVKNPLVLMGVSKYHHLQQSFQTKHLLLMVLFLLQMLLLQP